MTIVMNKRVTYMECRPDPANDPQAEVHALLAAMFSALSQSYPGRQMMELK